MFALATVILVLPLVGLILKAAGEMLLRRHGGDRPDFPGTGGELARHLLDRAGLGTVAVIADGSTDRFDPAAKVVRLRADHCYGRSVTAVAVAAHHCAHAVQDAEAWPGMTQWAQSRDAADHLDRYTRWSTIVMIASAALSQSRELLVVAVLVSFTCWLVVVALNAYALPVEVDAGFRRAWPALAALNRFDENDLAAMRRILMVCVSASVVTALASFIRPSRWLPISGR